MSKLLARAKSFWGWFLKKSPAFIVLTSLTAVSVFGLGVGGTLAATGVISNPFVSATQAPTEDGPEPSARIPGDGTFPQQYRGFDSLEELNRNSCTDPETFEVDWVCFAENSKGITAISESGWTGVRFRFIQDGYHLVMGGIPSPGTYESPTFITITFSVNGVQRNTTNTCWNYGSWKKGDVCAGDEYSPINSIGACLPGGDTYLIEVTGGSLNFRETGLIPSGVIKCPAEPSPATSNEPTPSPTTEVPTPEVTQDPSPIPTTEPSPTPTGP